MSLYTDIEQDEDNIAMEVIASRQVFLENETISLVCAHNVSSSTCPTVSWSFHGDPIIATGSVLLLERASVDQTGQYCCSLDTGNGSRHEACLQVNIYPYIDSSPVKIDTLFLKHSKDNVRIASSISDAHYSVMWVRNGVPLEGETGNVLNLSLNNTEDVYGLYQCFVSLPGRPKLTVSLARLMPFGECVKFLP